MFLILQSKTFKNLVESVFSKENLKKNYVEYYGVYWTIDFFHRRASTGWHYRTFKIAETQI